MSISIDSAAAALRPTSIARPASAATDPAAKVSFARTLGDSVELGAANSKADLGSAIAAYSAPTRQPALSAQTPEALGRALEPRPALGDPQPLQAPAEPKAATQGTVPSFGAQDFKDFLAAFGTTSSDKTFVERWDLNSDGGIDGADLSVMLANYKADGQ
jgi:hypothetical protein